MDDPFEKPRWNQLQATLWVAMRTSEAVRLEVEGQPIPLEMRIRSGEDPSGDPRYTRYFDDDIDLVGEIVRRGQKGPEACSFEDAQKQLTEALAEGRLRATGLNNGEGDRQEIPGEQWTDLRFYWTSPVREVCWFLPEAVNRARRYVGPHNQLRRGATFWTESFWSARKC